MVPYKEIEMRETFVMHTAYAEKFKRLSDEQFGALIRGMIAYQITGELPEYSDPILAIAFDAARVELDISNEKYEKKCQANRENGKRGGRPSSRGERKTEKSERLFENPNDNENLNNEILNNPITAFMPAPKSAPSKPVPENPLPPVEPEKPKREKKFVPPTVEEVRAYCESRKNNIDAETFVAFYESKNWMIGKNKMKDWKSAVITWEKHEKERSAAQTTYQKAKPPNQFQQMQSREHKEEDYLDIERRKLLGG